MGAGIGTAGMVMASIGRAGSAQDHKHDKQHDDCVKACQSCAVACEETFHHCFEQVASGKKAHAKPLHYVADCAKFCTLAASVVANGSPLMVHACEACAEACKDCAAECAKFDDAEMKACAESCKACESACRAMVKAMGGHAH